MKSQYPEAANAIQEWITKQQVPSGTHLPSSRILSEQIGFRRSTTEHACNLLIAKGVLLRTGYKLMVQAPKPNHSTVNGVVYVVAYWDGIIKTTGQLLTERGVKFRGVALHPVKNKNPLPALRKILAEKPAGIILWMPFWKDELRELESETIPIVISANGGPQNVNLNLCGLNLYSCMEKAILHLHELGHRQIAYLTRHGADDEMTGYYRQICLQLDLKQSARAIWRSKSHLDEFFRQTIIEERARHPEVTAIVGSGQLLPLFQKETIQSLKGLSMIAAYKSGIQEDFPLTTVGYADDMQNMLWTCNEIIFQIQNHEAGSPQKFPHQALFTPHLTNRNSTRQLLAKNQDPKTPAPRIKPLAPAETWRKSYPFLKNQETQWRSLNLSKLANHSMTREYGWLGEAPLLHFHPGLQTIHGIPFQVIDQVLNNGHSVITFRSPHTHSTGHERLPIRVKLPINRVVKALYFLHGCGWAQRQEPFAEYIIHFKNGKSATIPLISIGPTKDKRHARLKPNIHDWWRVEEAQDFPQAMSVTVYNPAIPKEYERVLYTLEWINPEPIEQISTLEIQVNPKAGPTLALIAITALL